MRFFSIKKLPLLLCACLLLCTGCEDPHPVRSYLQKLGMVDPDEYRDEPETGTDWSGSIPGIWSPQQTQAPLPEEPVTPIAAEVLEPEPVDEDAVNSSVDELIQRMRQQTGLDAWDTAASSETGAGVGIEVETTEDAYSDAAAQRTRNAIGLTTAGIRQTRAELSGLYAYEHLSDEGQGLYAEIYTILTMRGEDIVISTLDEKVMDIVYHFVIADHPELFYVDGYSYTRYKRGDRLVKIGFGGIYNCSEQIQEARAQKLEENAQQWLAGLPAGADQYEIAKYIYEKVIEHTEYVPDAPENQQITSVLLYGASVCQGYARAMQYLLNLCRVEATLVTGDVEGGPHAWVLALIDGSYTYIDPTWGDASYQVAEGGAGDNTKFPMINYSYLCVTSQELSRTHTVTDIVPQPACTDMSVNYYVREGEYFIEFDTSALAKLFERRYGDGSNNVTIKCSTRELYDTMVDSLIHKQGIMGYLRGENTSFSYSLLEDQYTIIVWLS